MCNTRFLQDGTEPRSVTSRGPPWPVALSPTRTLKRQMCRSFW